MLIDAYVLHGAIQRVPYIKLWAVRDDAQNNIIDQKASCGFWKSSTTHKTRKRVLQCRANTLLTQHQKFRLKLQPEPYCPMCKARKTSPTPFGTCHPHPQKKLKILEVCYTSLANIEKRRRWREQINTHPC